MDFLRLDSRVRRYTDLTAAGLRRESGGVYLYARISSSGGLPVARAGRRVSFARLLEPIIPSAMLILCTHTYALSKADSVECLCYIVQKRKKNNHVSFHLCTAFVRCSSYLGDTEDPKHLTPALCIVKLLSTSTHMPSDTYILYLSI